MSGSDSSVDRVDRILHQETTSTKLPRCTVTGQLLEVCRPGSTPVDEDAGGIRLIQREKSPCQTQQVVVVVPPIICSQLQYGTNGMPGGITEIAAVSQSIDRDRSHRLPLSPSSFNRLAHEFSD